MMTIQFQFKHRNVEDLEQLNRMLNTVELQKLELDDPSGYLATMTNAKGRLLHKRYGFDSITLICTPAKSGAGHRYRIDTAVASRNIPYEEYLDRWRAANPNRVIRTAIVMDFDEDLAYILANHEKSDL